MKRILIIDDYYNWQFLLTQELSAEGYRIMAADNIHDAIESNIDFSKIDLIVIDVHEKVHMHEILLTNNVIIEYEIKLIIYGRENYAPSRFNKIKEKILHDKHLVKKSDLDELKNEIKALFE